MPGLIWSSKGEVLSGGSGGAGVPDGTAGGQFLVWNAAAGEWQAQAVTPGDIGAAAAAHTHDWSNIKSAGSLSTGSVTDGWKYLSSYFTEDLGTIPPYYSSAVLFLTERQPQMQNYCSIWFLIKVAAYSSAVLVAGNADGAVSIVSPDIVRYTAPATSSTVHWLYLPFGVR